jgi:hypothetical protein
MALDVAAGSFVSETSAANNSVISGLGFQPKVIMLLATVKTTSDGFTTTSGASVGMASGSATTAQWAFGINGDDNVATSNTSRENYDGCLVIPNSSASAALWAARLLSFDAGGFTIDWVTVQATGIVIEYLALGGSDLSAECGRFTTATALGNQQVSTGMFTADAQTMAAAVDGERHFRTDAVYAAQVLGATYDNVADFVSFDSTPRFTINWTDAPGSAQINGYCVLRGIQVFCGSSAKPTGAAPQNQDFSVGFTPKAAFAGHAEQAAGTAVSVGSAQMSLGVSSASAEGSIWTYHNDTINTDANVRTLSTRILSKVTPPSTSAAEANADFAAAANSVRLVWTPNDANAHTIGLLALGDPSAAQDTPELWGRPSGLRGHQQMQQVLAQ